MSFYYVSISTVNCLNSAFQPFFLLLFKHLHNMVSPSNVAGGGPVRKAVPGTTELYVFLCQEMNLANH